MRRRIDLAKRQLRQSRLGRSNRSGIMVRVWRQCEGVTQPQSHWWRRYQQADNQPELASTAPRAGVRAGKLSHAMPSARRAAGQPEPHGRARSIHVREAATHRAESRVASCPHAHVSGRRVGGGWSLSYWPGCCESSGRICL